MPTTSWSRKSLALLLCATGLAFAFYYWTERSSVSGPDTAGRSKYIRQDKSATKVIVFVHGVLGNATSTWTHPDSKAYWPALLTQDETFSGSNIYTYEYPSAPLGSNLSINEIAENMRLRLTDDGVLNHPELVFLSHSMGGLITRAFLLKYRDDAAKVKFLQFYGTPTEGSPMAKLATLGSRNSQFKNMFPLHADSFLADLQRDWLAARFAIRSFCAYERKETFGVLVVDQRSATNLCTERLDPILDNHIDMVKPADARSDVYIAFRNSFRAALSDGGVIPSGNPRTDFPLIDPTRPINGQIRLFPEDKVRVYADEAVIKRVKTGGAWETFSSSRTYVAQGLPNQPVHLEIEPVPTIPFKVEVEYRKYLWEARDLNYLQRINPGEPSSEQAKCRHASHGVEKWGVDRKFVVDSGWISGGSNPTAFCALATAQQQIQGHEVSCQPLPERHRSTYNPFKHDEYLYYCACIDRADPVYREASSPACGSAPRPVSPK